MAESVDKVDVPFMLRVSTYNFHDAEIVHDRVLLVEGEKFHVQSGLLAAWSDYFRTLFNSDFQEKDKPEMELKDVSAHDFNVFLQIIYPVFLKIQAEHLEPLIMLSHRFLAPHVLQICTKFIDKEFDQIDKIMLYKVATMHEMESLTERTLDFIQKNVNSLNLIELLKLAFEHDLKNLKVHLRVLIYTAKRRSKYNQCLQCSAPIMFGNCEHKAEPLPYNCLIAEHIDELVKLPVEIQSFVLCASVSLS